MTGKLGAREAAPEQNIIAAFKFVGRENKALRTPSESSSEVEERSYSEDWEWFKLDTLKHLLFEKTVMIPEMNKRAWREAKILAIKEEGLRQCASIRVQARHRMRWYRALYLCKLGAVVCVQAYGRRYMYHRFYVVRRRQMDLSQLYRYRILSSYRLQSWLRYTQISREYKVRVAEERRG